MKLLLVIDVANDIAEAYEDFTVDYDLRGTPIDNPIVNESIKYIEGAPLKPLPQKRDTWDEMECEVNDCAVGWNACIEEITGEPNET